MITGAATLVTSPQHDQLSPLSPRPIGRLDVSCCWRDGQRNRRVTPRHAVTTRKFDAKSGVQQQAAFAERADQESCAISRCGKDNRHHFVEVRVWPRPTSRRDSRQRADAGVRSPHPRKKVAATASGMVERAPTRSLAHTRVRAGRRRTMFYAGRRNPAGEVHGLPVGREPPAPPRRRRDEPTLELTLPSSLRGAHQAAAACRHER